MYPSLDGIPVIKLYFETLLVPLETDNVRFFACLTTLTFSNILAMHFRSKTSGERRAHPVRELLGKLQSTGFVPGYLMV